jgi:hypothetical protein
MCGGNSRSLHTAEPLRGIGSGRDDSGRVAKQTFFTNQTERVTSAYTNSFSVLETFGLDDKEAPATKKRDIDDATQKMLAVQSELLVYDSVATELDKMYTKALEQKL